MTYELRPITEEEIGVFMTTMAMGFGSDSSGDEAVERFKRLHTLDRTVAAFDGDQIVGTFGGYGMHLTVPGGAQLPMTGTTWVTVRPTHRRRGLLRDMMRIHLDQVVDRGEPLAGLWATETGIYGRFGFGLAVESYDLKIDARRIGVPVPPDDLTVAAIAADDIPDLVAPLWSHLATQRSGFIDRGRPRWDDIILDPEYRREGMTKARHVVARRGDDAVGYVSYRQKNSWDATGSNGNVSIDDLVAIDHETSLALWHFVTHIDLFPNVAYMYSDYDDTLAASSADRRAAQRLLTDTLFVRILDLPVALTARHYESDGTLTLRIADDMGYADGTWRLAVSDGTATVEPTPDKPDVTLDIRDLGSLYLGRRCADELSRRGELVGTDPAQRLLGALFQTSHAPWCPEEF